MFAYDACGWCYCLRDTCVIIALCLIAIDLLVCVYVAVLRLIVGLVRCLVGLAVAFAVDCCDLNGLALLGWFGWYFVLVV